jgi:RNA polymerase sigma-70 factor, ECF subfamily
VNPTEAELEALMARALDGDAAAYRLVLAALRTRLGAYFARRLPHDRSEAEDLVQETLIAIHTKRATYDRNEKLGPWVYAIARYKLIDHARRRGRRPTVPLDDTLEESRPEFAVPDHGDAVAARRDLGQGLDELTDRTRELLVRVKLREEPVASVARRAGMTEGAVKVAVHRGLKRLAARLRGEGGNNGGAGGERL